MAVVKETKTYDLDTGEVLGDKKTTYTFWDDDKGYRFRLTCNQSRVFTDVDYPRELSVSDLGRIMFLQKYIQKDTNILVKRTASGYKALATREVIMIAGLKERQGKSFVKKLVDCGVLGRVDVNMENKKDYHYLFNPIYFHNSKYLNKYLYQAFKKWLDPYLSKWVKEKFNE